MKYFLLLCSIWIFNQTAYGSFIHKASDNFCPKSPKVSLITINPNHFVCDPVMDSLELVNFYNLLNGTNWDNPWNLDEPLNTWMGVSLTPDGCVQKLVLTNFKLSGQMPDLQLSDLEELKLITFSAEGLQGELPDFSGLPELKKLEIAHNDLLIGEIPDFTNVPNLKELILNRNGIGGTIPDFQNLQNLEFLKIIEGDVLGVIPDFSELPLLKTLEIAYTEIESQIPDFSNLPNLERLVIIGSKLSGNIPDFQYLNSLNYLRIGGYVDVIFEKRSNISGTVPDFSNLPLLDELILTLNQLEGEIPDFEFLPELTNLDLHSNKITDIPNFQYLAGIKKIALTNNELSGTIPSFAQCSNLESLRLSNNNFTTFSSSLPILNIVRVNYNFLTFEDILPQDSLITYYFYSPQKNIPVDPLAIVNGNDKIEIDLLIDENVSGSTYEWFVNNTFLAFTDNNNLELQVSYQPDDIFHVVITNPNADMLTLQTDAFSFASLSTSIDFPKNNKKLTLFPNPFKDEIIISYECNEQVHVELINILGQPVWKEPLQMNSNVTSLSIVNLPLGVYWVKIQDDNGKLITIKQVLKIE